MRSERINRKGLLEKSATGRIRKPNSTKAKSNQIVDLTLPESKDGRQGSLGQNYPATPDQPPKSQITIDLTGNSENCSLCSNVLGHGGDTISRIFAFENCGCVLCGECALSSGQLNTTLKLWCPKDGHSDGIQTVHEIFGVDCLICFESAAEKLDSKEDNLNFERIYTPCGHTFCRGCFKSFEKTGSSKCPGCRKELFQGPRILRRFQTIQRGVEIVSPGEPCGEIQL